MRKFGFSRREVLKILSAAPAAAAALSANVLAQQVPGGRGRGGRGRPQVDGTVTPSPTAMPGGRPLLTLYSISLQWAGYEEAADTAAVVVGEAAHAQQRAIGVVRHDRRAPSAARRRPQKSVSEHTNMRPPLSSTTISSRNTPVAPHNAHGCAHVSTVNG